MPKPKSRSTFSKILGLSKQRFSKHLQTKEAHNDNDNLMIPKNMKKIHDDFFEHEIKKYKDEKLVIL